MKAREKRKVRDRMKKSRLVIFFALVVIFTFGVLAEFTQKDYDLETNYVEGNIIKGVVNISFDEEPVESLLTSNFLGNISLLDFLELNSVVKGVDYNCSTPGCNDDYNIGDGVNQIVLGDGELLGLRIEGSDITSIQTLEFRVQGNNIPSCVTPLVVDILDRDEKILVSNNYQDNSCGSVDYGCFDSGNSEVTVTNTAYCNKITLPRGPAYKIGARVKNSTNGDSAELKMELLDMDGDFITGCTLPRHSQDEQDLECLIEYSLPVQTDYLVCIKRGTLDGVGEPNYKIKSETLDVCGSDNLGLTFTRDYEIFSKVMKFDTANLLVNNDLFSNFYNEDLKNYVFNYILDNYDGVCKPYCVVPIGFSGVSDLLTFSEIDFSYKDGNTLVNDNQFYKVGIDSSTIDSDYMSLDLEKAGFKIPFGSDGNRFKFYIGGGLVFNQVINISEGLDFDVNPKFVAFGQNAVFKATILGGQNITKSEWDFGDGKKETSSGDTITHRYLEEGEFELEVTLTRSDNVKGSRTFTVVVGDAEESSRLTIETYKERIVELKRTLETYTTWFRRTVEENVDPVELETELKIWERAYDDAETDENYTKVMLGLLDLKIPASLNSSKSGKLPLLIGFDNINVAYIEEISSRDIAGDEKVKDAISAWMTDNYGGDINFEVLNAFYDDGPKAIATKFKIDIAPEGTPESSYFIMDHPLKDIEFSTSYGERSIGDGLYISLGSDRRVFEFAILNEISADSLGLYISPIVTSLNVEEGEIEVDDKGFRFGLFIIGIIVLFIFALIIYIIMQEWYKRNYEHHLFKSDNELYNLINFIYNGRKAGMTSAQIKYKLKQSRWKSEQISYAIKKLDGKRTGMFEIPLFRSKEKKKIRAELMKRHPGTSINIG